MVVLSLNCSQGKKEGESNPFPEFELDKHWPSIPDSTLGNTSAIGVDSHGHVFIFHRANRVWTNPFPETFIEKETVMMLDSAGTISAQWGANQFIMPHGLTVDKKDNVWVTDVGSHRVFKFNHSGKLLLTLGEHRVAGKDHNHFNLPTDVAFAKDSSFYVSDGYGNNRVVKFSKEGKYLFAWGTKGTGQGQFNIPHGIALDDEDNVYVADRENKRIQVFKSDSTFIRMWEGNGQGRIFSLCLDIQSKNLYAIDRKVASDTIPLGADILMFGTTEDVLATISHNVNLFTPTTMYHDIAMDKGGNLYVCDTRNSTVKRFVLRN